MLLPCVWSSCYCCQSRLCWSGWSSAPSSSGVSGRPGVSSAREERVSRYQGAGGQLRCQRLGQGGLACARRTSDDDDIRQDSSSPTGSADEAIAELGAPVEHHPAVPPRGDDAGTLECLKVHIDCRWRGIQLRGELGGGHRQFEKRQDVGACVPHYRCERCLGAQLALGLPQRAEAAASVGQAGLGIGGADEYVRPSERRGYKHEPTASQLQSSLVVLHHREQVSSERYRGVQGLEEPVGAAAGELLQAVGDVAL